MSRTPSPKLVNVRVKLTSGRIVCFPVAPGTTIHQVCQKVAEEERVDACDDGDGGTVPSEAPFVCVKFEDKILQRSKTIADYGITEEMVLRVMVMMKSAIFVYLVLSDPEPEEELSCGLYNISVLSELKLKLLQAKPALDSKKITFHIGDMQLNLKSFAYEVCLEDGEKIRVRVKEDMLHFEHIEGVIEQAEGAYPFGSGLTSMKKIDVVISLSLVAIFEDNLLFIQKELEGALSRLQCDIPDIRIGFMVYGIDYTLMVHDLSSDLTKMAEFVKTLVPVYSAACNYEWMLRNACGLSWRADAQKIMILFGHTTEVYPPETYPQLNMDREAETAKLCEKGVRVHVIQLLRNNSQHLDFFSMTQSTGGIFFQFFNSFFSVVDVILLVCYRECGVDLLQAFMTELRDERRVSNLDEQHVYQEFRLQVLRLAMRPEEDGTCMPADSSPLQPWLKHPAGFNVTHGWSDASLFPRELHQRRLNPIWYDIVPPRRRRRRRCCTII